MMQQASPNSPTSGNCRETYCKSYSLKLYQNKLAIFPKYCWDDGRWHKTDLKQTSSDWHLVQLMTFTGQILTIGYMHLDNKCMTVTKYENKRSLNYFHIFSHFLSFIKMEILAIPWTPLQNILADVAVRHGHVCEHIRGPISWKIQI